MSDRRVGVMGATSHVGDSLLELLTRTGWEVVAFSRRAPAEGTPKIAGVRWRTLGPPGANPHSRSANKDDAERDLSLIEHWICLAPIAALPDYFPLLAAHGVRRVVALSTTGRFTKSASSDPQERTSIQRLIEAEDRLATWAQGRGAEWIILRPTLIYGFGRDRNISEIARFIGRFGFFPLLGKADGLRQPVHARDVAQACCEALVSPVANRAYTISGGETLTYREMVARVFGALNKPVRFLVVPDAVFRITFVLLKRIPRFRHLSPAMAERMNQNLAFDHTDAARDLGFAPSKFQLEQRDLRR